jgi:hypothetical protein
VRPPQPRGVDDVQRVRCEGSGTGEYRIETTTVGSGPTALGQAGPFTLVFDRPKEGGGQGLGFNGDYSDDPAVSSPIDCEVHTDADAPREAIDDLLALVTEIAEIPASIEKGTEVRIRSGASPSHGG